MLDDLPMPSMRDFGVRSPGHEGAGVVVKLGSNVKGWKLGDRGGVKPMMDVCFNCEHCWGLHETRCSNAVSTGLMVNGTFLPTSELSHVKTDNSLGTYQQYIVSPARYTTRIPDTVDDFTAGPVMCSGSTMYQCVGTISPYGTPSLMYSRSTILNSNQEIGQCSSAPAVV